MENNRNLFLSYQTDIRYKVLSQFLNYQSDDQSSSNDVIQNNTNVLQSRQSDDQPSSNDVIQNNTNVLQSHQSDDQSSSNDVIQNNTNVFQSHQSDNHPSSNYEIQNNTNVLQSYQSGRHHTKNNDIQNNTNALQSHQSDNHPLRNNDIQNNTNVLQNHQTRSHPTWSYGTKSKGTSSNKKVLLISLLIFVLCDRGFSQGMPVYDNTNFLALGKSLIESAKQTSQMIKTVKFLKDQKERVDKINSAVKQLKSIKELQDNNSYLYNTVKRDLREILNSPYIKIEEVNTISDSFNGILNNSVQSLDLVNQILKRDFFKMNDSERFRILEDHKKRSNEMVSEIKHKTKMYYEIIDFREMQDLVANRDAIN